MGCSHRVESWILPGKSLHHRLSSLLLISPQAYQQYVLVENWNKLTHPALVAKLPIPYRYYLPQRMRDSYKPRLEAAGLWGPHAAEEEAEPKTFAERQMKTREKLPELKFKQTFSSQKVNHAVPVIKTCKY
jgi:hypothetical protein